MRKLAVFLGAVALLLAAPSQAALTISDAATQNVTCGAGTCTATAADAVLNIQDLKAALAAGNLTVSAGSDAADIVVADKFQWAKRRRLTFSAFRSVIFAAAMTVEGSGGLTIVPNAQGGGGGELVFTAKGRITLWDLASSLVIAGNSYTLVGDLDGLAAAVAGDPAGRYALARMFDAQGASYDKSVVPTVLSGTFTGLGHTIANVHISFRNDKCGLFSEIGAGGTVRDLTLQNFTIDSTQDRLTGFAGTLAGANGGTVSNVTVLDGTVDIRSPSNKATAGGLAGKNIGTVAQSRVENTNLLGIRLGGMVGDNYGAIVGSHADAVVTADEGQGVSGKATAGGLVSFNDGTIELSSAGGSVFVPVATEVSGGDEFAGGLVARNFGAIDRSYATGNVNGGGGTDNDKVNNNTHAGGLVGYNGSNITNSYARGAVTAGEHGINNNAVGGFAGDANGIVDAYSTGAVTCTCGDRAYVGGFAGTNAQSVANGYWDQETSGQSAGCGDGDCDDVKGRTTAQLKAALPRGFKHSIWAQSPGVNDGYPYLIANPPPQ